MAEPRTLAPHDPLPEGPAVVLIRRLEEDQPGAVMTELVVTAATGHPATSRLHHPDGRPMTFAEALPLATARAHAEGLHVVWQIDRTGGALEQEVLAHHGDHSFTGTRLDDSDLEEGEPGADMRDNQFQGAPRRF